MSLFKKQNKRQARVIDCLIWVSTFLLTSNRSYVAVIMGGMRLTDATRHWGCDVSEWQRTWEHRGDYIKQEITRPSFSLPGPLKSPRAWVAAAEPPVSWFQSQELKPNSRESVFSAFSVCPVGLCVLPWINPGDWGVEYADWLGWGSCPPWEPGAEFTPPGL